MLHCGLHQFPLTLLPHLSPMYFPKDAPKNPAPEYNLRILETLVGTEPRADKA